MMIRDHLRGVPFLMGALALTGALLITAASPQAGMASASVITMNGDGFIGGDLTVPVGTEVTWSNNDIEVHTATSDSQVFNSGDLEPGKSFSFTFTAPGTYTYSCEPHPWMTGTITVVEAAPQPAPEAQPTANLAPEAGAQPVSDALPDEPNDGLATT
jgi:plastocyanin